MPELNNTIKTDQGVEVYENGIFEYLDQYMDERGISDMNAESMNRWNAALLYIYKNVFQNNREYLKVEGNINNAYDLSKIDNICNIYISLCFEYEKEISIMGFSNLTGISRETIHDWGRNGTQFSSTGSDIFKKLSENREESLSNRLYSGRGNPVGVLGILNRHYGWNMGQPRGQSGEQKPSIEQIQERYSVPQNADKPLIEPPKADFS